MPTGVLRMASSALDRIENAVELADCSPPPRQAVQRAGLQVHSKRHCAGKAAARIPSITRAGRSFPMKMA